MHHPITHGMICDVSPGGHGVSHKVHLAWRCYSVYVQATSWQVEAVPHIHHCRFRINMLMGLWAGARGDWTMAQSEAVLNTRCLVTPMTGSTFAGAPHSSRPYRSLPHQNHAYWILGERP